MDAFLEAWVHAEHRVCGYTLQPYSAGHVLALSAFRNPFAVGCKPGEDEGITPRTLLLASKVCGQETPLRYRPTLTFRDRLEYIRLRLFPVYFLEQVEAFHAYINDHLTLPETWQRVDEKDDIPIEEGKVRGPWLLNRIVSLISSTSTSLDEALRLPIGQLFWIDASLAELKGESVFVEEDSFDGLDEPVPDEVIAALEKKRKARLNPKKKSRG